MIIMIYHVVGLHMSFLYLHMYVWLFFLSPHSLNTCIHFIQIVKASLNYMYLCTEKEEV